MRKILVGVGVSLAVRYLWWSYKKAIRINDMLDAVMHGDLAYADQIQAELRANGVNVSWEMIDFDEV